MARSDGLSTIKTGILATAPPKATFTPRNKGLIAGLVKGNQWVFISPDHKGPRLFLGGNVALGGGPARIPMTIRGFADRIRGSGG